MSAITDKMRTDAEQDCEAIVGAAFAAMHEAPGPAPFIREILPSAIAAALQVIASRWRETGEALVAAKRQGAKGRRDQLNYSAELVELLADDMGKWRAAADLAGVAVQLARHEPVVEPATCNCGPNGAHHEVGSGDCVLSDVVDPARVDSGAYWCPRGHAHPDELSAFSAGCLAAEVPDRPVLVPISATDCNCHGLNVHMRGVGACLHAPGIANQAVLAARQGEGYGVTRFMNGGGAALDTAAIAADPSTIHVTWDGGMAAAVDSIDRFVGALGDMAGADFSQPNELHPRVLDGGGRIESISLVTNPLPGTEIISVTPVVDRPVLVPAAPPKSHPGPSVEPSGFAYQPGAALPAHLSHSALDDGANCGMKVRLLRVENRHADARPSMALVAGSAMDDLANEIGKVTLGTLAEYDAATNFLDMLAVQVAKQEAKSVAWPLESWHASRGGKEDLAWWRENGPKWAQDYLSWHIKRLAAGWRLVAVQAEYLVPIAGVPMKGFIDQIWYHEVEGYEIVDVKSGSSVPGPDQVMLYGYVLPHVLATIPGGWPAPLDGGARVMGRYYDARKGELTRAVNVHPTVVAAEVEYRVQSGASDRANWHATGVFPINTNGSFGGCGSCSIKRACPAGSKR
jgi:hypothetical protein